MRAGAINRLILGPDGVTFRLQNALVPALYPLGVTMAADSITTVRMPIRRGRRISLTVTLAPESHVLLAKLGEGNRSAGVEELVRLYRAKQLVLSVPESTT